MTSVGTHREATATPTQTYEMPMSERARRAAPLLVGAVAALLLLQPVGPLTPMFWLPLISGLSFLGAAAMAGPGGALWAPGIVLTIWSLQPASLKFGLFEYNGSNNLILGVALLVAALVGERLVSMNLTSLAIPVLFIGSYMTLFGGPSAPFGAAVMLTVLVATLAIWGLSELRPRAVEAPAER